MVTIIICLIVIALMSAISEFRIMVYEKQQVQAEIALKDREWRINELGDLAETLLDESRAMLEILTELVGEEEAMRLYWEKVNNGEVEG